MSGATGGTETGQDALVLLAADHRQVEEAFGRMEEARRSGDADEQRRVAQQVVHALSVHAVAEEELLYPLMAEVLPDGRARADQAASEHQQVRELLARVDGAEPGRDDTRQAWDELVRTVRRHVEVEEGEDFPELRQRSDGERLQALGERLAKAMAAAPTHPHPQAPVTGPVVVEGGPAATAVERVREALRAS